jgi:hypothetical protein
MMEVDSSAEDLFLCSCVHRVGYRNPVLVFVSKLILKSTGKYRFKKYRYSYRYVLNKPEEESLDFTRVKINNHQIKSVAFCVQRVSPFCLKRLRIRRSLSAFCLQEV